MTHTLLAHPPRAHPLEVAVVPQMSGRNRLTSAFRVILAIPHLVLVGGPIALGLSLFWPPGDQGTDWAGGGGLLGAAALAVTVIAWFAIVFTGRMPAGLWNFSAFYLRWRVRAAAYVALLRDEYPPFGEGSYMADVALPEPPPERNRVTVAFRVILALPHFIMVWLLGVAWLFISIYAWFAILFDGEYPKGLYEFAVGVLRWSTNVEGYLLLLHDEYPPFTLHA